MSTDYTNPNPDTHKTNDRENQPVVGLPGDERDMLITRVIDGVASSEDWKVFRAAAAHDSTIWAQLAETQQLHETLCRAMNHRLAGVEEISISAGMTHDQPLRHRLDLVSKWGGWAAAAAILFFWFFGNPVNQSALNQSSLPSLTAGLPGSGLLLDQAQPDQAFEQYLNSGQRIGQVVGEMPNKQVIETRPMEDGSIEVLYLRQIIERQIIDHAYREIFDETGNPVQVPIKLTTQKNPWF